MKIRIRQLWAGLSQHGRTITERTVRGAAWVTMGSAFAQLANLLQTFLVVQFLQPRDLGIFQLVMIAAAYSSMLTNTGVNQAVMQRKEVDRDVLDTAWVIGIGRNLVRFAALYLLADPIARLFDEPAMAPVLRVFTFKHLFNAFRSPGTHMLLREMRFKRHEIFEAVYMFCGFATTVVAAIILRNYWAFVITQLVLGFLDMIGSYLMYPFRPRFRFRMERARELIRFGRHLYFSQILNIVTDSLDRLLLVKLLGVGALGVYGLAKGLAERPSRALDNTIEAVTFPAYARLQDQPDRLRAAFLRIIGLASLIKLPLYAGLALVAYIFLSLLLPEQYHPGIPVFVIFCASGALNVLLVSPLFRAVGMPKYNWMRSLIAFVLFVPAVTLLAWKWGTAGAAVAQVFRSLVLNGVGAYMAYRCMGLRLRDMLRAPSRPLLATAAMGALLLPPVLWLAKPSVFWLMAISLSGALVYAGLTVKFNRPAVEQLRTVGRSFFGSASEPAKADMAASGEGDNAG